MKRILNISLIYGIVAVFSIMALLTVASSAQTMKIPASEVTTTAKFYKYEYKISDTEMEVIEYILVKSSTGEIKSCFNACEVCYHEHKGYVQKSVQLQCNNCGLKFDIAKLGSQGTGGCWPSNLIHTIDGDNVVIQVADLAKGLKYFLVEPLSVNEDLEKQFNLSIQNDELIVGFTSADSRTCQIIGVDGRSIKSLNTSSDKINVSVKDLPAGIYFSLMNCKASVLIRNS